MKILLQGIDPRKQLPAEGARVLIRLVKGALSEYRNEPLESEVFVATYDNHYGWEPRGDIGENTYDTKQVAWWCSIPEVEEPT